MRKKSGDYNMNIINKSNNSVLADNVIVADTFFYRLKGLMFKRTFEDNSAIVLYPCNSIHTFFMKFSLDVIFLSNDYKVIYLMKNIGPRRISPIVKNAKIVLELPSGVINKTGTKLGDFLNINLFNK